MHRRLPPALLALLCCWSVHGRAAAQPKPAPVFEKQVLPIVEAKCLRCHGSEQRKANLDLRTQPGVLKGGESGPAVSPGSPEKSLLWIQIAADKMPPGKEKLTEAEKVALRGWIEGGAKSDGSVVVKDDGQDKQVSDADRQFWAFQAPKRPAVPEVKTRDRVRNPLDAFVLAALEKKGLS